MADLGSITAATPPTGTALESYALAGTLPPGPTVPTTGQIWPRGNGS